MFSVNQQLLIQALGACFVAVGLAARLGLWKNWYWHSRGLIYSYVPLGLVFILYSFNDLAAERLGSSYVYQWLSYYVLLYQGLIVLLIIVGIWWSGRPPGFVKPTWVRWVEGYPKKVYKALARAVEEGEEDWESHVASQEALEAWVKALRGKKGKFRNQS